MSSFNTLGNAALTGAASAETELSAKLDAIYRKVLLRIVPLLFVLFLMAWIDRVNVGFTKLQMNASLGFSETIYGLGAGIFFIGYVIFEIPSNLVLQRFGARLTLSRIAIGWGLSSIALMFVTTPAAFYVLRFILGACEAGLWPGLVLYLTYWFPTTRSAKALALIGCGSSASGILGGPLAGFIMDRMDGLNGWGGWQWVFLLEGVPSVLLGIVLVWLLSDKPHQARWLTDQERELLVTDLKRDDEQVGAREHSFGKALASMQVWTFVLIYFCIIMGQSALVFWAPSILRDLGIASASTIGAIISGIFVIGITAVILNGFFADRTKQPRLHCGFGVLAGSIGCAVLGVPAILGSQFAILALCVALPGILCSIPVFWQLPNKILIGTAAAAGLAFINSVGNLAGFAAPFLMGAIKDATGQVTVGLWLVAAVLFLGAVVTLSQRETRAA